HGLGHSRVVLTAGVYLGPGRADLLGKFDQAGSMGAACKAMGVSYKRAWSLVQALKGGSGAPLVLWSRGGDGRGGASLTPRGREVLSRYRAMQEHTRSAIAADVAALRALVADPAG